MPTYLAHHGVKGMKWGERNYQYEDGSLTPAGKLRYVGTESTASKLNTALKKYVPESAVYQRPVNWESTKKETKADAKVSAAKPETKTEETKTEETKTKKKKKSSKKASSTKTASARVSSGAASAGKLRKSKILGMLLPDIDPKVRADAENVGRQQVAAMLGQSQQTSTAKRLYKR